MDFKSLLDQLSQLSEAKEETKTGVKHKAKPGRYGGYDPETNPDKDDDEKKAEPAAKRGRGRPKKGADSETGEVKKWDTDTLQSWIVGNKPKKLPGKASVKHTMKEESVAEGTDKKSSLKDWINYIDDNLLNEAEQISVQPAKQNTQVIKQGTKTLGTVTNPQLAQQIKQSIGKGEMTLTGSELGEAEGDYSAKKARAGKDIGKPGKQFSKIATSAGKRYGSKAAGERVAGAVLKNLRKANEGVAEGRLDELGNTPAGRTALRAVQKRGDDEITAWNKKPESGFSAAPDSAKKHFSASIAAGNRLHGFRPDALKKNTVLARDALRRHQKGEPITPEEVEIIRKWYPGFKIDEGQQGVAEADIPSAQMDMGAGLGAGRSDKTFEGKKAKPDFLDIDKDKNKKESMKKAASDKKKKKVTESSHRHSAARLMGKSHALAKEGYNCRYEDMDEAREYHEGFKEGLDECYGQGVYETAPAMPPATVSGMASAAMPTLEDEMDMYEMDRTEYMRHKASTTPGDTFKAFGQTFNDTEVLETDSFFESLDNQLQALLESEQVDEGMTVSISKGQQGMPDSVSVTAQDAEAEQLLGLIKTAGLGLFGDQQSSDYGASDQGKESHGDIEVVGDHDGMMSIMKKLTGQSDSQDYADEEGEEEETCDSCGEYESDCGCDHDEQVDEVENDEQREFQVSEDNPPDTGAAETTADENAEAAEDQALATQNVEEELNEWANDAGQSLEEFKEETFTTDDEFMIQTIAGGLNKPKSTGQTTIPVIAGQNDRMGYSTNESIGDWKKLAGLR